MSTQLTDHPPFDLKTKQEILAQWVRFVQSGFAYSELDAALAGFLWGSCKLAYLDEMPDRFQFWWEVFNSTTGDIWAIIVRFGLGADPYYGSPAQDWLMQPAAGDLCQAMCDVFAPVYNLFLDVLTDFENERALDLKAEAVDRAVARYRQRYPELSADDLLTLALREDYDWVVNQDGGIPVDEELRARLRRAAHIIEGQSWPVKPQAGQRLKQPILFETLKRRSRRLRQSLTGPDNYLNQGSPVNNLGQQRSRAQLTGQRGADKPAPKRRVNQRGGDK